MSKKVFVKSHKKERHKYPAIPFGLFYDVYAHDINLSLDKTFSTFSYSSGALRYTSSESEHELLMKIPDMKFIGYGHLSYNENENK